MIQTLKNAWKTPELRGKILFTILILLLYRLGANIPVPFIDADMMATFGDNMGGLFEYMNLLSGQAFSQGTLFALNVSPYITASIVVQLLTIALPPLERWAKEGEAGKKKLNALTRYTTVGLALITAIGYTSLLNAGGYLTTSGKTAFGWIVIIACFCAGSSVIMWLAEKINEHGIGNGISMILFANIISSLPATLNTLFGMTWWVALLVVVAMAALVLFIVFINDAERRIPIQYAKRVVGRKVYGGQNTNLPIKVSMSGVLPVIFAGSICSLPATVATFMGKTSGWWYENLWSSTSAVYCVMYGLMIFFFSWFYSTIQYDPVEIANNLKKNGGFIPGFRPGKPTADFIKKVISKIVVFGAVYLAIVALLPIVAGNLVAGVKNLSIGGTSVIIVVGVALETVKAMEAQMLMRHYKGFLD